MEEGVHPKVVEEAKSLEAVDVNKSTEGLEVKATSTKDHLAMETLTSVPFARQTIKGLLVQRKVQMYSL